MNIYVLYLTTASYDIISVHKKPVTTLLNAALRRALQHR